MPRQILTAAAAGLGLAAAVTATAAPSGSYKGYEMPPYTVERSLGNDAELRRYGPHLVASTLVRAPRDQAVRKGFRTLAGFIFGGNATEEKIAMTVPVAQVPQGGSDTGSEIWRIDFMVPAGRTAETLPQPDNSAVRFSTEPGGRFAVLQFSGWATAGRVASMEARLRATVAAEELTPAGPARTLFYDDPFTAPWNRRNEVAIPVE